MPDVVVRIVTETKGVEEGIKQVERLGKVGKDNVKHYNDFNKAIEDGVNDALKEAGISGKQFADAIKKGTKEGAEGFKSLRQQIRDAKDEATRLAAEFGENSTQAINAQKNVANLTESLDDFNKRVAALNPEAKFRALEQVTQGAIGGFQALTGALQVFGVENEEVQKIAQRFQGILNVTQGISSLASLKDALTNLKVVLGVTTVAQTALAGATEAEGAAALKGAAANTAFAASLSATGIGAIAVALGAIIGAFILYQKEADKATEAQERFNRTAATFNTLAEKLAAGETGAAKLRRERIRDLEREIELSQARGESAVKIAQLELTLANERLAVQKRDLLEADKLIELYNTQNNSSGKLTKEINDALEVRNKIYLRQKDLVHEIELAQLNLNEAIKKANLESRSDDVPYLPTKKEVKLKVEEIADVFKDEIPLLSSQIPPIEIDTKINLSLEEIQQGLNEIGGKAIEFYSALNDLSAAQTDARIADLTAQKNAGILSEEEYKKAVNKARREQAQKDKSLAIFQAIINTAAAVIKALPNIPLAAASAAIGAIQLAAIQARPIPEFNKGTLSVPGVDTGKDTVLAKLRPREAVIPVRESLDYKPALRAIYNRTISPKVLNHFVQGDTKVQPATFNPYDMRHAIKGVPIKIQNADYIIEGIGEKLSNRSSVSSARLWR